MARLLRAGAPRGDARLAVIMLHGRNRDADEMAALAASFDLDGVAYLCPEAPGKNWYPKSFMAPIAENEPDLSRSLATVAALAADLAEEGFANRQIVLCGFSQGACLAAESLARRPDLFGGGVILTGGLIGPPGAQWPVDARHRDIPLLVTGSAVDEWVPEARTRETVARFEAAGAAVEHVIYPDRPHVVCDNEIARAKTFLRRLRDRQPEARS